MRLGVTRAAERLTALSSRATSQGIEIIPIPFTKSLSLSFELPDAILLDQVDWIFFTSANGVRSFFAPFDSVQGEVGKVQGNLLGSRTQIAAVGDKTAEALKTAGHEVDFQPTTATGKALFKEFIEAHSKDAGVVLYVRAKRVNFDPQELFAKTELKYYPVICYETVSIEVDQRAVARLDGKDYILFTAPSAVRTYNEKFGSPTARPIAIGPTTGAAMTDAGWTGFKTMKQPDVDRVLEYL